MVNEKELDPSFRPVEDIAINDVDKVLLRKIDWRIVPILFLTYFFQFLDKVIINYANIMGLQKDLKMEGNDYSWTATAFFIGFAVAEFPQGAFVQRFSVTKVLGINVFFWGVIICCSAACHSFTAMLVCRIILGTLEAVVAPALIMITSAWYTKSESTPRYGLWYCGLGVGQIFGGLVSFAAQHAPSSLRFEGWRIMFVVVGAANILVAMLCSFGLPESVDDAKFLTAREKRRVLERLTNDQAGTGPKVFTWNAVWATFGDLQVVFLCLLTILITTPSGVITTYSAILIKGFGYTSEQSALLNIPSGVVSIVATMLTSYSIYKGYQRTLIIALVLAPALVGAGLMCFLPQKNQAGCLVGIYLVNCTTAPLALIYALVGANLSGYTKKVAGSALISACFSIANIIGPQTFQAQDAPGYIPAKVTIVVVEASAIIIVLALRIMYMARNNEADKKNRPAMCSLDRKSYEKGVEVFDSRFRYVL